MCVYLSTVFSSLNKIYFKNGLIHRKVLSLNWHRHCCLCVCCIVCPPERSHSLGLQKVSNDWIWLTVALNLCEEVDALLAIEVAVAEERAARSGEAHHRQRHRDRHIHLDEEAFNTCNIFSLADELFRAKTSEIPCSHCPHSPRSGQHLFRCRIALPLLRCLWRLPFHCHIHVH